MKENILMELDIKKNIFEVLSKFILICLILSSTADVVVEVYFEITSRYLCNYTDFGGC